MLIFAYNRLRIERNSEQTHTNLNLGGHVFAKTPQMNEVKDDRKSPLRIYENVRGASPVIIDSSLPFKARLNAYFRGPFLNVLAIICEKSRKIFLFSMIFRGFSAH